MYFAVTDVEPLDHYLLQLTFKNGEQKKFDMKPYLEISIFQALRNESMFKTVKVSFDTIAWANDADLDPEMLYNESI